jgi:hypothetical protein
MNHTASHRTFKGSALDKLGCNDFACRLCGDVFNLLVLDKLG